MTIGRCVAWHKWAPTRQEECGATAISFRVWPLKPISSCDPVRVSHSTLSQAHWPKPVSLLKLNWLAKVVGIGGTPTAYKAHVLGIRNQVCDLVHPAFRHQPAKVPFMPLVSLASFDQPSHFPRVRFEQFHDFNIPPYRLRSDRTLVAETSMCPLNTKTYDRSPPDPEFTPRAELVHKGFRRWPLLGHKQNTCTWRSESSSPLRSSGVPMLANKDVSHVPRGFRSCVCSAWLRSSF